MRIQSGRLAAIGLLISGTTVGAAGTRFGLEAGVEHDSNVNRAAEAQSLSDQAASVEGYASRSVVTGPSSGFVTRFALRAQAYRNYTGLSHLSGLGRFSWRYQPDPSFTGAWIDINGSAEVRRHADSPIRDGELLSLGAGLGKYFTDRLRTHAGFSLDRRFASESDVYDLASHRWSATIDWRMAPAVTLYAGFARISGDQAFAWAPASGSAYRYGGRSDWYSASARDDTFDGDGRRFWAYRADSTTNVLDLGVNFTLDGQTAIDLSATRYDARADRGPSYDGFVVRALFLRRFR